ncbi:MAG TPA: LodA/GoxA family CTQ-dependent oxidase [Pseudonocardia sp.]|nr:LodA/GoxA family CTQ-dependent oxidase [Pseudonocardia sp.]
MPDLHPAYLSVHPAIGVARVGNSLEHYFVGPEVPGVFDPPEGGYKEDVAEGNYLTPKMKRQAARFRVFAYDSTGQVIQEITAVDASISWTVHLANKKAEWDRFEGRQGEDLPLDQRRPGRARNQDITDRASLVIDPGPRTVTGPNGSVGLDGGQFLGLPVDLGEIRTDGSGRLLVLGGAGRSGAAEPDRPVTNYANNDRWFDDTSDGPVTARVTFADGTELTARPAWVLVGPPDFAPAIPNFVTLYDVAREVAVARGWLPVPQRPSFTADIYPVLARAVSLQWVNQRALDGHGPQAAGAGFFPRKLLELASADEAARPARERVFRVLRNPHLLAKVREGTASAAERATAVQQAEYTYMPSSSGDDGDAQSGVPGRWLTLTALQYDLLARWAAGDFEADWTGQEEAVRPGLPLADRADRGAVTPDGLDRAALESASGGGFFPGIEASWVTRNPAAYAEPFRFDHTVLGPGDVTKRMAVPWQADFYECRYHWWPWQRPDDVLTSTEFDRLIDLDRQLAQLDPNSPQYRQLRDERARVWEQRVGWARTLPDRSPAGDNAMVTRWPSLGVVVSHRPDRTPFELLGQPAFVETETMKYDNLTMPEYYHILVNIEDYPDFTPKARELATGFLAAADYASDPHYARFDYSAAAFDRRMQWIYDDFVTGMFDEHWLDTGVLNSQLQVGRFSDAAVIENLRQKAPFNLVDGAWLQNILKSGPCNEVQANLFAIWADEAGNGRTELNHCNVYETLLRSVNIYLPPVTSREFIESDLLPSGFEDAVFQMSVGLFPQDLLPELLGMTLYLEWEATPTLTPMVRLLEGRRINPQFYRLHVAIDNIASGHGALAKQAIKLYLDDVREKGGDAAVQAHWQRIWSGYVTWATTGTFGGDLAMHLLLFDGKLPDQRKTYAEQQMTAMITRKAPAARKSHGTVRLGDRLLNELFDDPPALMKALVTADWVDPGDPRGSRFFRELISFTGPMYKVFTEEDQNVILDWIESLDPSTEDPTDPTDIGSQVEQVLIKHTARAAAEPRHDQFRLPRADQTTLTVREWFGQPPEELMAALARSTFITPGAVDTSPFFTEVVSLGGLMDRVLPAADVAVIRNWVTAGCPPPGQPVRAEGAQAGLRELVTTTPAPFATRRLTIGYGSVH